MAVGALVLLALGVLIEVLAFGVTGRSAAPLAKTFDLIERHIVTGKMKHAIEQHRAVSG